MEAIAGFVVGYLIGTQHGRDGLEKLRESWAAISQSDEFKGVMASALSVGQAALQQGLRQTAGGTFAQGVAGVLVDRARDALSRAGGLRAVA